MYLLLRTQNRLIFSATFTSQALLFVEAVVFKIVKYNVIVGGLDTIIIVNICKRKKEADNPHKNLWYFSKKGNFTVKTGIS